VIYKRINRSSRYDHYIIRNYDQKLRRLHYTYFKDFIQYRCIFFDREFPHLAESSLSLDNLVSFEFVWTYIISQCRSCLFVFLSISIRPLEILQIFKSFLYHAFISAYDLIGYLTLRNIFVNIRQCSVLITRVYETLVITGSTRHLISHSEKLCESLYSLQHAIALFSSLSISSI